MGVAFVVLSCCINVVPFPWWWCLAVVAGGGGSGMMLACRYHLQDVIVGKIYFLLVRIKVKHMELQVIKRESTGTGIAYVVYLKREVNM